MIDIDRARALLAARSIAATAAVGAATITPRTDPSAPLSPTQKGLWFASRYEPDSAAYTVPVILRLVGDLDRPALLAAVRELSRRHHVLRSVIRDDGDEPAAVLGPEVDAITVELPAARLAEALAADQRRPFRLDSEPPMRATLYVIGAREHVLALTFHHVAFDAWSHDLVLRELSALYTAADAPPPALQYADVEAWRRSRLEPVDQVEWWAGRLAGLAPVLELPTDRRRAGAGWAADEVPVTISADLAAKVGTAAAVAGC